MSWLKLFNIFKWKRGRKMDEIKELKAAAEKKGPAAKKPAETKADVK